ncbi:MAG: hypothetical protein WCP28_14205 [Actinomycetes bacterium]
MSPTKGQVLAAWITRTRGHRPAQGEDTVEILRALINSDTARLWPGSAQAALVQRVTWQTELQQGDIPVFEALLDRLGPLAVAIKNVYRRSVPEIAKQIELTFENDPRIGPERAFGAARDFSRNRRTLLRNRLRQETVALLVGLGPPTADDLPAKAELVVAFASSAAFYRTLVDVRTRIVARDRIDDISWKRLAHAAQQALEETHVMESSRILFTDDKHWMKQAGLLVNADGSLAVGGFWDITEQLGAEDPEVERAVMDRLKREWADDYILTGSGKTDRQWKTYRDQFARDGQQDLLGSRQVAQ